MFSQFLEIRDPCVYFALAMATYTFPECAIEPTKPDKQ